MKKVTNEEFRSVLSTIKELASHPDFKESDCKLSIDFLKSLRYICEFNLLKSCYDKSEFFKSSIPDIETELIDLGKKINELEEKLNNTGELSELEEIKLKANRISYQRFQNIKDAIINRNFASFNESMNRNLSSARQVIAVCNGALFEADLNYLDEFIIDNESKSTLDVVEILMNDEKLRNELNEYYKKEATVNEQYTKIVNDDKEYLDYLHLAENHQIVLRDYMLLYHHLHNYENKKCVLLEEITHSRAMLESLDGSVLTRIKNNHEKVVLEAKLQNALKEMNKLEEDKKTIKEKEEYLNDVGLGPVINELSSDFIYNEVSIPQKVADLLKNAMSKRGLNVSSIEESINKEIENVNMQIERRRTHLIKSLEGISPYAKNLLSNYHDKVKNLLNIIINKDNYDISPIFAAYIMKGLMLAQNLSYEDINDITNSFDEVGIKNLVESFEDMVKASELSVTDNLISTYRRPIFDTTEPSELKIA